MKKMDDQKIEVRGAMLLLLLCLCSGILFSQSLQVGHKQANFVDPARSNRNIPAEIYYPSNVSGNNVTVANGQFPVIVFGHGFSMGWSAYEYLWDSIVPHGYIMVFPTTENSFSPSHTDFGKDMAFLIGAMKAEGLNTSSLFFGSVTNFSCLMGHSMGGGCAFLAQQYDTIVTAIATIAGAVTTPSSITAAQTIYSPALVLSGENDCVAPPQQHQVIMYDSLSSACKTYVSIDGASHCQFADFNSVCYFGEGTCQPQAEITETFQKTILINFLKPWLDFYLKNDCASATHFQTIITAGNGITSQQNCSLNCVTTDVAVQSREKEISVFPNPFSGKLTIVSNKESKVQIAILSDVFGKEVRRVITNFDYEVTISRDGLSSGLYFLSFYSNDRLVATKKIIVTD